MIVHRTSLVRSTNLGATEGDWLYNGLDCCITLEVLEALLPQLDAVTSPVYDHARELQGPILEMECRGVLVDEGYRRTAIAGLEKDLSYVQEGLAEILIEGLGLLPEEVSWTKKEKGFVNTKYMWNSHQRLKDLFYNRLGLNPIKKRGVVTLDRNALEKLQSNFHVTIIVSHILKIRDLNKKLSTLRTGVDKDGRLRSSYNIAGTDTGRLASYAASFGSGTNMQNITEELRKIFVADPGKKLAYIDRAQIQSRAVGAICWNLFGDSTYLDFCESGDLHTGVCMMTWPNRDWMGTGLEALTNPEYYKHNRALADEQFYRVDSYRQGSKKLGHATNFLGKAPEISRQTRIPVGLIVSFQYNYFRYFSAIVEWHKWLRLKIGNDGWITTFTGRRRSFFGRRWDHETVKQGAAYEPQDVEAFINQSGMLQLWRAHVPSVEILVPVHDAILIQYDEDREEELLPQILQAMHVSVPLMNGRDLVVPNDVQVGWNWCHAYNDKKELVNPDGLISYRGPDKRRRSAPVSFLDRKLY